MTPLLSGAKACRRVTDATFRCAVVGEGTLPIVCSEMLQARGHRIIAMASPDRRVLDWARSNGVAAGKAPSGLAASACGESFDYLFSISNFQRLSAPVLAAAERGAINYHDAPLPRYAGSHATSWALLNGETQHAVTWHGMTLRMDGGDIVKQVLVDIADDDTALTLNAKCYEAAVSGFSALLDDIEAGILTPLRQDSSQRTFFRRGQRPTPGCTLQFDVPATQLHALLRALDFGPYPNPLGLPKLAMGESFYIVTELEVLQGRSGEPIGSLLSKDAEQLIVATASEDVALGGFFTLEGTPKAVADVVGATDLRVGERVGMIERRRAERLIALCAELAGHEPFWIRQLKRAQPTPLSGAAPSAGASRQAAARRVALALPDGPDDGSGAGGGDRVLAVLMALLARHTDSGMITVGFRDMRLASAIGELGGFFAESVPLRVRCDHGWSVARLEHELARRLAQIRRHCSYARDLPLRIPALLARGSATDTGTWPISVEIVERVDGPADAPLSPGRTLVIQLADDGGACAFHHDPDVLPVARVEAMVQQFMWLVEALPMCGALPIRVLPLPGATQAT